MTDPGLARGTSNLRSLTSARVSLPMSGRSVATSELLDFQLAEAQARDAVHAAFDSVGFVQRLRDEIPLLSQLGIEMLELESRAVDRASYLRNPQLGRALHPRSAAALRPKAFDLAVTVADGLSPLAVERNAIPFLQALLPLLIAEDWMLAPITVVRQGRVAICDEVGERLQAKCGLILIGERPGLSAADSMGAYLTWEPRAGRTDAERNCLSNIREGGLNAGEAATRLMQLLTMASSLKLTGVELKEGVINPLSRL